MIKHLCSLSRMFDSADRDKTQHIKTHSKQTFRYSSALSRPCLYVKEESTSVFYYALLLFLVRPHSLFAAQWREDYSSITQTMSLLKSIYQLSPWAIFLYSSRVERSNIWYCAVKCIQRFLATSTIPVRGSFFPYKVNYVTSDQRLLFIIYRI